ncbi:MAG: S49 family peptidase, partial [Chlamydiia bacterium]|nr:S49 family peptidase [Chlamydiia bacterium]
DIYSMLKQYKEQYKVPIYAYVDGLCASGGMYIASSADKIFASPSSAIGSVGVIYGPFFNISQTLGKVGVEARTLTEGIDKDALNPTRPWKEGEDQWIKDLIAFSYNRFLDVVTQARPKLTKDQLLHVLGARMFNCVEAEKLGYIDHAMSSRRETLLALMQEAHIDPAHPYQVVQLEARHNWLNELVKSQTSILSGKIEHRFDVSPMHERAPLSYLYQPQ